MNPKENFKETRNPIEADMLKNIESLLKLYEDFVIEKSNEFSKTLADERKRYESQGENIVIAGSASFKLHEFKKYVAEHNKNLFPLVENIKEINDQESSATKK